MARDEPGQTHLCPPSEGFHTHRLGTSFCVTPGLDSQGLRVLAACCLPRLFWSLTFSCIMGWVYEHQDCP